MDPPELASEHAPCYARRGRIEPPGFYAKGSNAMPGIRDRGDFWA
jgi:hypothetical protein